MGSAEYNPGQARVPRNRWTTWMLMVWATLATLAFVALLSFESIRLPSIHDSLHKQSALKRIPAKRNVIFMVSDGMGPASVALARNFFQYTQDAGLDTLTLDKFFVGNSRTQSSDSFVTDSAAGATAYSCGLKTYNGAIAVDPDAKPCASIMEAAKLQGYRTGLVVTTRITDATPASFASHARYRSEEDFIAEQLVNWNGTHPLGNVVDLLFGGGRCHFLPSSDPLGCRQDERNLVEDARSDGFHYIENIHKVKDLHQQLPVLGLFAPGDLPFSIDYHDKSLPALSETAQMAVHALGNATKDSDKGFFLMVEGSRIDHAGHYNDPGAQVREVMAYSDAFAAMAKYAMEDTDVPTIVVSTSDHETGGLSVSRQITKSYPDYLWYPEVLERAKHSTEFLAQELRNLESSLNEDELHDYIEEYVLGEQGLGFRDITQHEIEHVAEHRGNAQTVLAKMQSLRAQVGWSTHGHSAVDVNVYAASNYPEVLRPLRGGNENIEVGHFLRKFMGIKRTRLASLTTELRKKFHNKF